jgi:hypothetical protein
MIDLETLGLHADCVILSIGAIQFDLETGDMDHSFGRCLDIDDQLRRGRTIEGSTLRWWLQQDKAVLESNMRAAIPLEQTLYDFGEWMYDNDIQYVWANGTNFDLGILKHAYNSIPLGLPWDYGSERDYKTLRELLMPAPMLLQRDAAKHNALADCRYQIENLYAIWKQFNKRTDG